MTAATVFSVCPMTLDAIPPDGLIARRYVELDGEGMTDEARKYMWKCLIRAMRDEEMPDPPKGSKITKTDQRFIQEKVHAHLPTIRLVREGEVPLLPPPQQQIGLLDADEEDKELIPF
jgi:hypothetical protein